MGLCKMTEIDEMEQCVNTMYTVLISEVKTMHPGIVKKIIVQIFPSTVLFEGLSKRLKTSMDMS